MSEREQNIRGIHYEMSKPKKSPYDGYYYQRVRQVGLVGLIQEHLRSNSRGSN